MKKTRLLVAAITLLLLSACVPRLAELPQPPERLQQYGYSFMPPNEAGWYVGGRDGQQVTLVRRGASRDETVVIMAGNVAAPRFASSSDFEVWVRDQLRRDAGASDRFTVQKEETAMIRYAGTECARTHLVTIDHMAKKRSGDSDDMVLEVLEFLCRHPDHDGTITILGYSQRAYPAGRDPNITDKAQALFDSLEFLDF